MKRLRNGRTPLRVARRCGVLTLELVLTLPILLVLLAALFEFTLLFYSRSLVVEAARAATRHATLPGATQESVENEINRILSPQLQTGLQVNVSLGTYSGDIAAVIVQVPMSNAAPDLLWPIGVGLTDRYLIAETRMVTE